MVQNPCAWEIVSDQNCYQSMVLIINIRIKQNQKKSVRPGLATGKNVAAHQVRIIVTSELDLKKFWSGLCLASKVSLNQSEFRVCCL